MGYYNELARRLRRRYLDSLGNVVLQKPADVYSDCNHAATAITDLLARAEAAEERAEKAEKCIEEIEDALKFGRESAAMLRISEYHGKKEE